MENVFKEKYVSSLSIWKQKNDALNEIIEEYHQLIKEDLDWLKQFDKKAESFSLSVISDSEIAFMKMLKRLNKIIKFLLRDNDKVIKYEILQKICTSYNCIEGIETLRIDRIFDTVTAERQYERAHNMIQQYIRMSDDLMNKFREDIVLASSSHKI